MFQVLVLFLSVIAANTLHAQPLRIGVSESILSLPLLVAQAEGYFTKRGVEVELVKCVGGNRCLRHMLAGDTDLATATELPVVFNSFERSDFAVLTSFVTTSRDVKMLVRRKTRAHSLSDFKGKAIGYVQGTASQYVLDLVLVYSGVDPSSVNLVAVTPETAQGALEREEIDGLVIWEPFAARIQQYLGTAVQLQAIPRLYTETFNLMAMKSAIVARPVEMERLLLALKDGTDFIRQHPASAKSFLARRFNIPLELVASIFHDYHYRLSLDRSFLRTMEGQARWASREGYVNQSLSQPNYSDYLHSSLLKKIDPDAVSFP